MLGENVWETLCGSLQFAKKLFIFVTDSQINHRGSGHSLLALHQLQVNRVCNQKLTNSKRHGFAPLLLTFGAWKIVYLCYLNFICC